MPLPDDLGHIGGAIDSQGDDARHEHRDVNEAKNTVVGQMDGAKEPIIHNGQLHQHGRAADDIDIGAGDEF